MPKHQPAATTEPKPKVWGYYDQAKFVWSGSEWTIEGIPNWWHHFQARSATMIGKIEAEFGSFPPLWTLVIDGHARIERLRHEAVVSIDPISTFLRAAIDDWVDHQYSWIWNHVYDQLRLVQRIHDMDAAYRADVIAAEFESLYEPSSPRKPVPPKRKR